MQKAEFEIGNTSNTTMTKLRNQVLADALIQQWLAQNNLDATFVNDENCFILLEYLDNIAACRDCKGLEYCPFSRKGYALKPTFENGILNNVLSSCKRKRAHEASLAHLRNFSICHMSEEQLLNDFDHINYSQESDAYLMLVNEMKQSLENDHHGFYLYGNPGVGKTFLTCCYINAAAKDNRTCAFVNVPTLINDLKAAISENRSSGKLLNALKRCDVLVLDDFGGDNPSKWSRDEIFFPLLNERMERHLTTLFSSNYSLEQIEKTYQLKNGRDADKTGAARIMERVKSLSKAIVMPGKSRR